MPDQRRPAEIRPLPIKRIGNRSASCDTGRMEWCLSIAVWFVFDLGRVVQAARSTRRLPVFACNLQRRTPEAVLFESPEMKLEKILNNIKVTALTSSMKHILKIRKTVLSVFIP